MTPALAALRLDDQVRVIACMHLILQTAGGCMQRVWTYMHCALAKWSLDLLKLETEVELVV